MEKEQIVEKIPHKRIEVDVKKLKTFENQFTYRAITEISAKFWWYDLAFPVDLVNCETKVFASVAERNENNTCATSDSNPLLKRLSVWNVAGYDGGISILIWLGDTNGSVQGQIDLLGFTWG
jgi:hypothetical protein